MNIHCIKWGKAYSSDYVNKLFSMVLKHSPEPIDFYCHTDDPTGIHPAINIKPTGNLEKWWNKIDVLQFDGDNILFDLDIIILNKMERLFSVKTRTISVLPSMWKDLFCGRSKSDGFPTPYNSSVMKWSGTQGLDVYNYFYKHKEKILFAYKGVDKYFYNEMVEVDILPSGIAYSYWRGGLFRKDTQIKQLRKDYEICIFNEGTKQKE